MCVNVKEAPSGRIPQQLNRNRWVADLDWPLEATHLPNQGRKPSMVSVSVRRNRREPVGRNAQPDDPRHNRAYPHPENPGLFEQVDGWFDWAGRRLFLADGSPDPMTPGAYRYQTRPDLTDLDAPDSDPWSPRYEPPHLRHRPGDTWIIDRARPHDPDDPGPFGSPGWRPDPRTGRHRRDELPDPTPPWEQAEARDAAERSDSLQHNTRRSDSCDDGGESGGHGGGNQRDDGSRGGGNRDGGGGNARGGGAGSGGGSRCSNLRIVPDYPSTAPRKRTRFWADDDQEDESGQADCVATQEEPYRFEKLREDAWDRFVIKSSELAASHWADRRALECQHRWPIAVLLRMFRWLTAVFKGHRENEAPAPVRAPRSVPVPRQVQPQADRAPQTAEAAWSTQGVEAAQSRENSRRAAHEEQSLPGAQMAQAIRSVQAARVRLAVAARETRADQSGATPEAAQANQVGVAREAQSDQSETARRVAQPDQTRSAREARSGQSKTDRRAVQAERGAAHWRGRPREERPRPSPLPYIARWEQAFDAHRAFGEVAVL
ncbi:hypothetical protein [Glycomyces rhizosphaerae]|uniref:Uncharacterized protein n=1 Tax=Glycomyces rhizosphaerae TaxID=2054422 RepID=A0ABV7Q3S0_9ACTN